MKSVDTPTWDLSDLYSGIEDPKIASDLSVCLKEAGEFEKKYRGKISPEPIPPREFLALIQEVESIRERADRVLSYADLVFAADTHDPSHGAFLQRVRERLTEIEKKLLFFDLEWAALPDERAKESIHAPELARYRHFLETLRRMAPHRLSEPEEKILAEKANTGVRAFQRLFDEAINNIRFDVEREGRIQKMTEQEALALLYHPHRDVRRAAAKGLTEGFQRNAPLLTFIFNQVVADHAADDRLRRFPDPMAYRNLSNEIDPGAVETLLSSCEGAFGLVARYYTLKKRRLGLETLYDYDRYAPLASVQSGAPDVEEPISFNAAKEKVLSAFHDFSPKAEEIASLFFQKGWIDAAVRPGKRGGAFSHGTVPGAHPYVFVNFLGTPRDVMTLAHELGHGIHQWLSREQSYLNFDTPLTTAETASVFAEMLVFHRFKKEESNPARRLALLMEKLEESFATVFRQAVLCRFEQVVHAARRNEGELSPERLNEFWTAANRPMFQDSVVLTDDYGWWWSYIPHFIHSPFYTYAYAFGHLLVLALYQRYLQEGKKFVPKYLHFLSAGGSRPPDALLLEKMDLSVGESGFWKGGLDILERMLSEAERLAEEIPA